MIHPSERKCLLDAVEAFKVKHEHGSRAEVDAAFVALAQAASRVVRLLEIEEREAEKAATDAAHPLAVPPALAGARLGDPCPRCHALALVRDGTCVRCLLCHHSSGCGG